MVRKKFECFRVDKVSKAEDFHTIPNMLRLQNTMIRCALCRSGELHEYTLYSSWQISITQTKWSYGMFRIALASIIQFSSCHEVFSISVKFPSSMIKVILLFLMIYILVNHSLDRAADSLNDCTES